MRQLKCMLVGAILLVSVAGVCGTMTGCDSSDTSQVTETPEVKKANQNLQEGMKDFMNSKGKGTAPAKK